MKSFLIHNWYSHKYQSHNLRLRHVIFTFSTIPLKMQNVLLVKYFDFFNEHFMEDILLNARKTITSSLIFSVEYSSDIKKPTAMKHLHEVLITQ